MKIRLSILGTMFYLTLLGQNFPGGLILYYDFNANPSGGKSIISDKSKYANNGTIIGNTTYTEDRFGIDCGALWFDGNTYLLVPDSKSLSSPNNQISISVWINIAQGSDLFRQWITVCSKGNGTEETANNPHYRMQATAQTISLSTNYTRRAVPLLSYDTWYHYVYTYDGNTLSCYLDGVKFYEEPCVINFEKNNLPLEIGRDMPGICEYFLGSMDDLMIYNTALTEDEVIKLNTAKNNVSITDYCKVPNLQSPMVDQTSVENKSIPEVKPPALKPDSSTENNTSFPDSLDGQYVDYQAVIDVKSAQATIYLFDNEKEDGDIVSINVNGIWVKEDLTLQLKNDNPPKEAIIRLRLNKGENNYLVSKAISIGKIGLNTLTLEINDGKNAQLVTINADIGKCGGIKINADF